MSFCQKLKIKHCFFLINPYFFVFLFLFITPSTSKSQIIDSIYYSWAVYEIGEDISDKKCYIASTPYESKTSFAGARTPYFAVTRYYKNRSEEVSVFSGYEYKISSEVHILIGGQQKHLFTEKDTAFAKNEYEDKEIIEKMLNSETIKVRSDSSFGNYAVDEYSLKGFNRAYERMKTLCK